MTVMKVVASTKRVGSFVEQMVSPIGMSALLFVRYENGCFVYVIDTMTNSRPSPPPLIGSLVLQKVDIAKRGACPGQMDDAVHANMDDNGRADMATMNRFKNEG